MYLEKIRKGLFLPGSFYLAEEGEGGGASGAGGEGEGTGEGTGEGADEGTGEGQGEGEGEGEENVIKMTQAEFDAKIEERLSRERKKYEDYDELKNKAKEYDKQRKESMSEQERLQAEKDEVEKEKQRLEGELAEKQQLELKRKALSEQGLPEEWADRVKGDNENDIKTDVKNMKKMFGTKEDVGGPSNPEKGGKGSKTDEEKAKEDAKGRGRRGKKEGFFDPWG